MKKNIIHLSETDSTNRYLRDYKPADDELMTVVTADFQTSGRGQGSNTWESERGKNLLFSILIHPTMVPVARQFLLSEVIALALYDALSSILEDVKIKWPNDIYVGDRKICGTLIENSLAGGHIKNCIFGTGIDVNQHEFKSDAPNPVSIFQLLGHEIDRDALLDKVLNAFEKYYFMLENGDYTDVSVLYHESLYRRKGYYRYRDQQGEFEGALVEVEDDGHLILHDKQGVIRSYAFKEIEYII